MILGQCYLEKSKEQCRSCTNNTVLADMFQQSDSESNHNTKEPEGVAELELVSYLREKPVLVNSDSEEDKTNPQEWWKDNSY